MGEGQTPETTHSVHESGHDPAQGIPEALVRTALDHVLQSQGFRSSRRSQEFLRYVVERTLEGQADALKERTIGIDVFGRSTSYDPSDDATVRVKAGEVRKRLGLYYSDQGAQSPLRIELPSGTYVPEFRSVHAPTAGDPAPAAVPPPLPSESARTRVVTWRRAGGAGLVLMAAAALIWTATRPATTVLDEFWAPVLKGNSPVFVCAAYVPVWNLDQQPNAKGPPRPEDYVSLTDQFVGGGDLIAASRLTSMLTRMRRPYRLKVGNDVSFADLRSGPAILVGYSYTRWQEISSQMRYFIDGVRRPIGILDNGKPTAWNLPNLPRDRRTNEDY